MHHKIATLGTNQNVRIKIDEVYNWFAEKITSEGGSYQVPKLDVLAKEIGGISGNTLGKYLKQLVRLGLLTVDKRYNKKWRYARYILPAEGQEADSITEEMPEEHESYVRMMGEVSGIRPGMGGSSHTAGDEQAEEVSEVELVPYIEGHSQLILNERRICDFDLAPIYGVSTGALNRAYKRNLEMFEDNWVIQLDGETWERLCQSGITLDEKQRFRPEPPLVYNAEGANSVAFQLKQSPIARKRAKTIIKVFTDLERMAHGEEPKQPGFAEAIAGLVEYNKLLTTNIFRLTSGVEAIKVDLDERKADKTEVAEVKQTVEEVKAEVSEVKQTVAGITDVDKNRIMQADVDQFTHISASLNLEQDKKTNPSLTYGEVIAGVRRSIKGKYHLGDGGKTTHVPISLLSIVWNDAKKKIFKRLQDNPGSFYQLPDYHQKFLIHLGYEVS